MWICRCHADDSSVPFSSVGSEILHSGIAHDGDNCEYLPGRPTESEIQKAPRQPVGSVYCGGVVILRYPAEFLRGTAAEVRAQLATRDAVMGEITRLIGKAAAPPPDDTPLREAVDTLVRAGVVKTDAIKHVAQQRGLPMREVYDGVAR